MNFSRRHFFGLAGTGLLLQSQFLTGQPGSETTPQPAKAFPGRPKVALVHGDDRRKNVYQALLNIDDQIQAGLRRKKYVVIKPNNVSTEIQLASTHVDALRGVLDYLEPRFHGPVVIAESSAGDTLEGFESFNYPQLVSERRSQKVSLVDLNREGEHETISLIDYDLHMVPVRLAARLLDPDAYVICCAVVKTHNAVVATLSVKNMSLGAPLHSVPRQLYWNDKRKYHAGVRQTHCNILLTAQKLAPNWGATVIDGFEGMQGNGPTSGTPVPSRVAIASTDYIAADRVALEAMSIDPAWVGYLTYCGQVGLGQYDLSKIDVVGPTIASVQKKYRLHSDIDRELQWMGPLEDLPPKLGRLHEPREYSNG
jgi:uncharacterized protein (DUF362 family)